MASQSCSSLSRGQRRATARWNLDEFLALVSHELRNSINATLIWAEYLGKSSASNGMLSDAAEAIKRNGTLQINLVEQLLNLSKAQGVALRFDQRILELGPIVDAVARTMSPVAALKAVELRANLDTQATILGDPVRLHEVFTNLLSNAIKYTPAGGIIEIRCGCRRGYAQVTVRDTGRGIGAQFLPHIYDRFRREKTGGSDPEGLGLGLAAARYIVERHHGRIYAMSQGEGKGTTFRVYLPLEHDRGVGMNE